MTHFTVGIIIPLDESEIESFIAEQMERYYEHSDCEPYVCYSVEEAAAELERDIKRLERIIERQHPDYDLAKCRAMLAGLRRTTPERKYREHLRGHESFNDQGEPLSTYNPDSKWDWYRIGGRWDGWITGNEQSSDNGYNFAGCHETIENNMATTGEALDRNLIPHAIVTPDGLWHERGQMGWWANLITENENWDQEAKDILARHPGCRIVILDAHI
jgi:hypothetical protein